jgi:hypothetical protein
VGHEDQFPPRRLNGRYRLGEATFARASGNDEVAPKPVIELRFRRWLKDVSDHPVLFGGPVAELPVTFSHWRNLNFDVLPCRLILQHRGTGQKAAAEDNARDDCRDNKDSAHVLTSVPALARS